MIALLAPAPAAAYQCGASTEVTPVSPVLPESLEAVAPIVADDCPVPETLRHPRRAREAKKASMSGLTVFVLAVAAALLIPIGRNGVPTSADPFRHDRPY